MYHLWLKYTNIVNVSVNVNPSVPSSVTPEIATLDEGIMLRDQPLKHHHLWQIRVLCSNWPREAPRCPHDEHAGLIL